MTLSLFNFTVKSETIATSHTLGPYLNTIDLCTVINSKKNSNETITNNKMKTETNDLNVENKDILDFPLPF